jgi:processive 1,2-diacylglycerol beta-glucosyltransferase
MVTKAGGVTTAECLSKSLPMVFLRPVPGQEEGNALYFEREGAGVIAPTTRQVVEAVCNLLADDHALRQLAVNARRLFRPGAEVIAAKLREMLAAR